MLVTALGSWEKQREGDPKKWSTVQVTALGSWETHREGDPKGWYIVLVTALGSWEKTVPRGHPQCPSAAPQPVPRVLDS